MAFTLPGPVPVSPGGTEGGGTQGKSAYEVAVDNGFSGSESDWLASLHGSDGDPGPSAYEIAQNNGFGGNQEEWLTSLEGPSAYEVAQGAGFSGTTEEWLASLVGPKGDGGRGVAWAVDSEESDGNEGDLVVRVPA